MSRKVNNLISELKQVESQMVEGDWLSDYARWKSVDINFCKPNIERLWTPVGDNRLNLHVFQPCAKEDALYHRHAWPVAIHVVLGKYNISTGFGIGEYNDPEESFVFELLPGNYYEMLSKDSWHAEFSDELTLTITLSGPPWKEMSYQSSYTDNPCGFTKHRRVPKSPHKLPEIDEIRKKEILDFFKFWFS